MSDIFDAYKPLRNYLRQAELTMSLGVMRAYLQYMQFNQKLPNDIEVIPQFLNAKHVAERKVYEWELETLVREIIINSPPSRWLAFPKDLRKWDHFAGAVNKFKDLENEISKRYYSKNNVLIEFHRLAHREFPWQTHPNGIWINRYYKIFSHPRLATIIERVTSLTVNELYTLGLVFTGFYFDKFALDYPPRIEVPEITREKFDLFVRRFSTDIGDMKKKMEAVQQLNENYIYTFNPLRQYPLVRMPIRGEEKFVAPAPTLLFWRFTSGVYYEIYDEVDFSIPFGESFQNYVGEVIKRAIDKKPVLSLHLEGEYRVGNDRKDTIDWIVDNGDAALFVEVKTKRLRFDAKIALSSQTAIIEELGKMAEFICQVYATILDYRRNLYPKYKFDPKKKIFPLIVTLENWYLFGDPIEKELMRQVLSEFEKRGLDESLLDEMPYSICSIEEFEKMIQIMATHGILRFMENKLRDPEKRLWPFASFMTNQYWDDLLKTKDLFPEVMDEINPAIRKTL